MYCSKSVDSLDCKAENRKEHIIQFFVNTVSFLKNKFVPIVGQVGI